MRPTARTLLALGLAAGTAAACRPKPPATTPEPAPTTSTADADRARREADERARREADDRARREAEERERERAAREAMERMRAVVEATVYFEYDASDLDSRARESLTAKIPFLQQDQGIRLNIVGHADERGSDEYNVALGMRRAAAARRFLVQRGIAEDRIAIESMGEERPVCQENEESCWRQNRRAEFSITSGGTVAGRD